MHYVRFTISMRRKGFHDLATPLCSGRNNNNLVAKSPKPIHPWQHFVGEVAQLSDIILDIPEFACLNKGDPVWVKRTDKSWTNAVVKERVKGPNASVVVMVSGEGATKKFSMNRCAMFLRKVANDDASQNEVDKSATNTVSSSHSSSVTSMEDSMRTFLDSVDQYFLHHQDEIFNRSMQHHAESMHRLVDAYYSHHNEGGGNMHDRILPMSKSSGRMDNCCPKRIDSKDPCPKRHVTFKLHHDQSLKSSRLNNDKSVSEDKTCQQTASSSSRNVSKPPSVTRRGSWSMEINKMAEGLLKIPTKKMEDLKLSEMSPQCQVNSTSRSSGSHLSEVPPLPFGNLEEIIRVHEKETTQKKKFSELEMGDAIYQSHGKAGHESFKHALLSIHKRSSVFLPSESGGGITLH